MLQAPQTAQATRVIRPAINSAEAQAAYEQQAIAAAQEHFWFYRQYMNPRLILRGKWFPRSVARKLRQFWEDFRAGKRPVMLLETPPQHGA
jgi:hypothetical protein